MEFALPPHGRNLVHQLDRHNLPKDIGCMDMFCLRKTGSSISFILLNATPEKQDIVSHCQAYISPTLPVLPQDSVRATWKEKLKEK